MPLPSPSNTTHPRGRGFGALIGDLYVRLAVGPERALTVETAPLQAPSIDTRQNPEELTDDYGQTYARSDFTGGEGIDQAHERDPRPNASRRYYDSRNVDVSTPKAGETRVVTLLHTTAQIDSTTSAEPRMAVVDGSVYVTAGTTLRRSDNPLVTSPTWAADNPHNGEVATTAHDVTALGTTVYAALGVNGIHRKVSGAWSHWNDLAAVRVWAVLSRVMASDGASLYEVTAAGAAPSALHTLPTGMTWTDAVDVGGAILASATDGNVYAFGPDTAGALELKGQTSIKGEVVTAIGEAQGFVFYGTREQSSTSTIGRLWQAQYNDSTGTLANAQLLREWESDTLDRVPRRILTARDRIYTLVPEDGTETHAWRYDLTSAALTRSYIFTASGVGYGLAMLGGKLFASINNAGVWRQSDTYASEGWLIGPMGDFFSASIKSWVGARLDVDPVEAGERVELHYTTDPDALTNVDATTWSRAKTISVDTDEREAALSGLASRGIAGMVKLFSNGTSTPGVRSFSFRAYPGGGGNVDKLVSIPVNISDQLERPNRRRAHVKGWGTRVYEHLRGMEGSAVQLELLRPAIRMRGLLESVGAPMPAVSERGSPTLYALVKFRGRETVADHAEDSALGLGQLGVMEMGL